MFQFPERNLFAAGPVVLFADHGHQRQPQHLAGPKIVGRRQSEYEADVEFAVEQALELGACASFPQVGDQPGVGGVQPNEGWLQDAMTGREVVADVDRASAPGSCVAGGLNGFAGLIEYPFCFGLERDPRRCESDFVGGAGHQLDADFAFKALQVLAQ